MLVCMYVHMYTHPTSLHACRPACCGFLMLAVQPTLILRAPMRHQGDVLLRLFPDECPRTVENFTTHARNGYYDGVIFHRVIKGFMLQTGDPLGAARGGGQVGVLQPCQKIGFSRAKDLCVCTAVMC